MNQKSGQNSLGLDNCFEDEANPIDLFKKWFAAAEKSEINDPNALSVATSSKEGIPSVRMVLLKGLSQKGFVFYTNFNSKKGKDLKENPQTSMCFHWKSLRRQIRISGKAVKIEDTEADQYYNSRAYGSRIGAWASSQSQVMKNRNEFLEMMVPSPSMMRELVIGISAAKAVKKWVTQSHGIRQDSVADKVFMTGNDRLSG